MSAIDPADQEYTDEILEGVSEVSAKGCTLKHDGWSLWCPAVEGLPVPRAGESLRLYGRGVGYSVRGIVIGGRVYRYETADEEAEKHRQYVADEQAKRQREMDENHDAIEARVAALPEMFRERIHKFRRDGGVEFQRDYEPYELFCCEQAVVIADALKTADAIKAFHQLSWKEQTARVPGLSDVHSGNTFWMAVSMAHAYVSDPAFVVKMHGALTPLVGCEAYGCAHGSATETNGS